jgi:hypothetical protein
VVHVKIKVEWQDGEVWRSVNVQLAFSRKGNYTFSQDGKRYVFKEKKEGEPVFLLEQSRWVKAGRVTRNCIFLGEGMSSDEYYQTPGGIRSAQEALQSFLNHSKRGELL